MNVLGIVSEHDRLTVTGARVTYRVWHAAATCSRFLGREVVARDVPIHSDAAGLPCSFCAMHCVPVRAALSPVERLERLVASKLPGVDFGAQRAKLEARGEWTPRRIAAGVAKLDTCSEPTCNTTRKETR